MGRRLGGETGKVVVVVVVVVLVGEANPSKPVQIFPHQAARSFPIPSHPILSHPLPSPPLPSPPPRTPIAQPVKVL